MNASEQIYTVLSSDAGVQQYTSIIRPAELGEHDSIPAIVYYIDGTDVAATTGGDNVGLDQVNVQIDAWASSYPQALAMGQAIRSALRNRVPLVDDPTKPSDYLRAQIVDCSTNFNDTTKRHGWSSIFHVWQTRSL